MKSSPSIPAIETVLCFGCNVRVRAEVRCSHTQFDFGSDDCQASGRTWAIAECPECQSIFLVSREFQTFEEHYVPGESHQLYPTSRSAVTSKLGSIPESVSKRIESARRVYEIGEYESAVMAVRKALEAVCQDRGVRRGNLATRIDELAGRGVLDGRLHTWAHELRVLGNEGAHEIDVHISRQDAADALDFVDAIVGNLYVLTEMYTAFKARRSASELPGAPGREGTDGT